MADLINNSIFLRRRNKIGLPPTDSDALLPVSYIASMLKNIEPLGFGFSERLMNACRSLSLEQLTELYGELIVDLRRVKGAHHQHQPMYPNFPSQVMEMGLAELYFNAIIHYWTDGQLISHTEAKERFPLIDNVDLQVIDLGSQNEFEILFTQIAASNTSLSEQDKEDLEWFVKTHGSGIDRLLPEAIPQKENMACIAGLLMRYTDHAEDFIARFCRTATDVLRLAVALSDGDISLAKSTRFRTFSRAERRSLLAVVDRQPNGTEDMLRWKGRWIRLGEKLHPGEYQTRFPIAAAAFDVLRNDRLFTTFNGHIEKALAKKDVPAALERLRSRPGDLARRLDHLLRLDPLQQGSVITVFSVESARISTPVLLQVLQHFKGRNRPSKLRVFFPKGNLARAQAIENTLSTFTKATCAAVVTVCEAALLERFRGLPPLGRVFVDPLLSSYLVPFSNRSASRSYRTIVRGSQLPLPATQVLRFFVWWKNGIDRTDIDLSATLLNGAFEFMNLISYYNLKGFGGCHSGDIVDAPEGASEFIDINLQRVREQGGRYLVMTLNSYTQQPYCNLPECFAGWMARDHANSGEIYEPATVQDRIDITADTRIALPLVIDVMARKVIWCDMSLKNNPNWFNNVHGNLKGINLTVRALADLNKPNLYDLFMLHARARGQIIDAPENADTVFSVKDGTPFRQEMIAAEYLQ